MVHSDERPRARSLTVAAFSENGYYLATGAADATVKLWDLRKLKNFQTLQPAGGAAVHAVRFDYSGGFLAVGSAEFRCLARRMPC